MKMVLVWDSLNHLMLPLCRELLRRGAELSFIATSPLPERRIKLGFADLNHSESFVVNAWEDPEQAERAKALCRECDVLILNGRRPDYRRLAKPDCVVFVFSERLFKGRAGSLKNLLRWCKYVPSQGYTRGASLLCASAYAARDYALLGQYRGRAYRFGYFAEIKPQQPEALWAAKEPGSLLWAGRLLDWKHPETAVHMAERLQAEGMPFSLKIIGDGEMRRELETIVGEKRLTDCVQILGAMPPEQVRAHMERSQIYLFTSDRGEGWGGVLNESMNSCCLVLANEEIGAAPYLLSDGVNGFLYTDEEGLYQRLRKLLAQPEAYRPVALAANETVQSAWNAEVAAERLLALADALARGEDTPFPEGPCSKA